MRCKSKYTVDQIYHYTLHDIDTSLQSLSNSIDEFGLVNFTIGASKEERQSREFEEELNYNISDSDLSCIQKLNYRQREDFNAIIKSVNQKKRTAFFVDGPAGSGKTFLYQALILAIRSEKGIPIALVSSRVTSSLLPGGRTTHSRFKRPIIMYDCSCAISKQTVINRLIIAAKFIIWDEASMDIEAVDTLLQDLMEIEVPFGGKTIVFQGDYKQTIPIVSGGNCCDAVDACLINSHLWSSMQKFHLIENMRARDDKLYKIYCSK